jgi:hypothetical protein
VRLIREIVFALADLRVEIVGDMASVGRSEGEAVCAREI